MNRDTAVAVSLIIFGLLIAYSKAPFMFRSFSANHKGSISFPFFVFCLCYLFVQVVFLIMPFFNYSLHLRNQLIFVWHVENVLGSEDIVAESAERIFCGD